MSRFARSIATGGLAAGFLSLAIMAFGVTPTFVKRNLAAALPAPDELTANQPGASYRPLYGGREDPHGGMLRSVARYGELSLEPGARSATISYPAEEQIYFVLEGEGTVQSGSASASIKTNDFLYVPPGSLRSVSNGSARELRILVMGFRVPQGASVPHATSLMVANAADVPSQTLASHGPTTQFRLLMGTTQSTRDRLSAASQMVSLFIMEFAPGGTNIPHHHPTEEEIYFILRGNGEMVAGGGADGVEGRHPTRAGDAWFLRLNTTVGYYSGARPGDPPDRILAVRSTYPFPTQRRP